MIKRSLGLMALSVFIVACGGGKYEHSEIPATTGGSVSSRPSVQSSQESAAVGQTETPAASTPAPAGVAASNSKPVIYDYPGSTRQIGVAPVSSAPATAAPATTAATQTANSESGKTYVVQSGDTLWRIAKEHGVSVSALKQANGMGGDAIKPGQTLQIP